MTEQNPPTDEGINAESDAKAPITGADPQGESEPDTGTKAEQQTEPAPAVSSEASEAETDRAEAEQGEGTDVARADSAPEVLQVRKGMFGVQGTGDVSGMGGLVRRRPTMRPDSATSSTSSGPPVTAQMRSGAAASPPLQLAKATML